MHVNMCRLEILGLFKVQFFFVNISILSTKCLRLQFSTVKKLHFVQNAFTIERNKRFQRLKKSLFMHLHTVSEILHYCRRWVFILEYDFDRLKIQFPEDLKTSLAFDTENNIMVKFSKIYLTGY